MASEERNLTDEQVKIVVNNYIVRVQESIFVKKGEQFYRWIHQIAKDLGYINHYDFQGLNTLTRGDILKCVEQIWNYALEGILAPGSLKEVHGSVDDINFPYFHLTEKGKKVMKYDKGNE